MDEGQGRGMLRNYLVVALRNLARHKLFSFINVIGLAVGLACAVFILLFLRDELSYNSWIPGSQNLYRVETTFSSPGRENDFFTVTPFPVVPTMQAEIPQVVAQTHMIPENGTAQIGDRQFAVNATAVDPNFLQVIKLPLVLGNPATALAHPESIILSETMAKKFFGAANPIGKIVVLGGTHALTVTGVLRDLPHNTDLIADLLIPNTSKADVLPQDARTSWLNVQGWGYVKLAPHADPAAVMGQFKAMINRHVDVKKRLHMNLPGSDVLHLHLTRLGDVHLAPFGRTEAGSWTTIYGFAAIAVLILLIACFNYMNLATARATTRAREISLRKVMGANRSQLIVQFMGESILTAVLALVLAFAIVEVLLPGYDSFLDRPIAYHILSDWPLTLAIVGIALAAGILGGIYPALLLSAFRPAAQLGAGAMGGGRSGFVRATLVVLQFAISIGLGIAMIVMFAQISYARQVGIGFDRHNIVVIGGPGLPASARDSLAHTLAADPAIAGVAQSNMVPFDGGIMVETVSLPDGREKFETRNADIDPDFVRVYGMKLLAGRNLSRARGMDVTNRGDNSSNPAVSSVLINAAAARQFGFTVAGAVGRNLLINAHAPATIVGVIGDANFDGMQTAMQPFIFFYDPKDLGPVSVRMKPGHTQDALAAIDRTWHRFVPTVAIQRQFQDASFDRLFTDDERESRIFSAFVGVAIFVACLGLFGLASFTSERRTREIGIRKVFGARTHNIVRLLLWQFSIPVLIANVIAWPVAWYYLHHWLQGYAYRISLNPLYFLAAGLAALAIAWVTVIIHTIMVARARPIHALRYE
jgi:putative ABC transport system permease protein